MRIFVLIGLILSLSASAEVTKSAPVFAPLNLGKPIPDKKGNCERLIRVGNEVLACDSPVATDAENLRTVFKDTPEAIEELNTYQQNRKKVRAGAYVGTLGIFLILGNSLVSKGFSSNGEERKKIENTLRLAGFALTFGTVAYGVTYLRSNESHLQKAIDRYNEKNPERKIEFLLQTHF